MKRLFLLAAACCLSIAAFAATGKHSGISHDSTATVAKHRTVTLQIVHNGSPLRNVTSLVVNGVDVGIPGTYATSWYTQIDPTQPLTVTITYDNLPASECFNAYVLSLQHQPLYNVNYKGVSTATFTVNLPAGDTNFYLQFLDNIGCSN